MKTVMVLGFLVFAGVGIWIAFALAIYMGWYVIPTYPTQTASLREIMDFYQKELAKQGRPVQIRLKDETGCDEPRDVRGIAGNGYIFLSAVSKVFDTDFNCGLRRITIGGVGSKSAKDRRLREGKSPSR